MERKRCAVTLKNAECFERLVREVANFLTKITATLQQLSRVQFFYFVLRH